MIILLKHNKYKQEFPKLVNKAKTKNKTYFIHFMLKILIV
jgi:hypothetical protein